MKLLVATGIYPPSTGGPATYSKLLYDTMPERGIRVKVVSFDEVRHLPKCIRHFVYLLKVMWYGIFSDCIYAQDPVSVGLPAYIASVIIAKPFVLKIVGDYAWEQGTNRFGVYEGLDDFQNSFTKHHRVVRVFKYIERFVARRATRVITPSNYLKSIIVGWGVRDEMVKVIYNSAEEIGDIGERQDLRARFGFVAPVLITVGRLVPWKGITMLIGLMQELSKKFPEVTLLVVGDGPEKENLEKEIERLHLSSYVRLVGRKNHDELFRMIKASDLFLLNTGYEGFSHQLLEVMALETPIISTAVGGNPELIQSGTNGILVRYNNKGDFLHEIEKMLLDPEKAKKLSNAAKIRVGDFSTDRMLSELKLALTDVIKKNE